MGATVNAGVCSSSLFMERMWRDLPPDILEKVVSFLPLASLLRFKTVSRGWNRVISHREFVLRHTRASTPEEYVLVTVRFDAYESYPIRGWEVLDVATKRFFTVGTDFLTEYVKRERLVPASLQSNTAFNERAVLAADGGLFCVSYSYLSAPSSVLLVCNPVLRAVKRLPPLTGWVLHNQRVVMKTDRASMEYEVFIVNDSRYDPHFPRTILTYESKTGEWRTVPNIPLPREYIGKPWCSVSSFMGDEFYEPFNRHRPSRAGIISYDKVTGVLSDLGVDLPFGKVINLQLVVSNDRLFCVTRSGSEFSSKISIWEIIPGRKEYVWLTEMPTELVSLVLGGDDFINEPFVAIGCANSIFVCSVTGRSVAYGLSTKMWHHYPRNNLREALHMFGEPYQEVLGSNYCLSLCVP